MTQISAAARLRTEPERAVEVLVSDPAPLLGHEVGVVMRHGGDFHQDVVFDLGPPETDGSVTRWPIHWQPAGHTTVLPAFAGTLEVGGDAHRATITVSGAYRPPLGIVGVIVDSTIGHRVAEVSVEGFVRSLARRIDHAAVQHHPPDTRR